MAQASDSDFDLASGQSGTAIRLALNGYMLALQTKNSGPTAPADTFPGMNWIDTSVSPALWNVRNQADDNWDLLAQIDPTDGIQILNEGAAVPGTAVANIFTQNQTIDTSGSAAALVIKSDRTSGIAASIDGGGHDSGGNDTIYGSFDLEIVDNTDTEEAGQWVVRVLQEGGEVAVMTVGSTVEVNGILNATTLQQGGTSLDALIEAEIDSVDLTNGTTSAARAIPANATAGDITRFTGSSASTWTVNAGTAGKVYTILNDGTADITFAAGGGITIVGGLNLGQQKMCSVIYITSTRVYIRGENT